MTSKELLTLLSEEGSTLSGTFYSMIASLSKEQLNWKYDMRSWCIAECLDHLNITNNLYFPIIERAIFATKGKPEFQDNGENFMHTLTGNMMIKMVRPENRKKSKAPTLFQPSQNTFDTSITQKFTAQHKILLTHLENAMGLSLAAVKVYSPANKVFKFNLGDCFAMIIHHDRRHFEQMLRMRENPAFPLKQFAGDYCLNIKLLGNLSLFGILFGAMSSFGLLGQNEWIGWLLYLILASVFISRRQREQQFLHGALAGFIFSALLYATQTFLLQTYIQTHPEFTGQVKELSKDISPASFMMFSGMIFSAVFGLVVGMFTLGMTRFLGNRRTEPQ